MSDPLYRNALQRALRQGYTRRDLMADVMAGLLVGVVALPLSMGLAIASGVKPEYGLYTAIVGGLLISLLGGSRTQIGGPAGAFVGLCAAGVAQFGPGGLAIATFMAGAMMLAFGLLRLGRAITFIPVPVVIGFTTGIAVIIASTQVAPMLGLPEKSFAHFHERIAYLWSLREQATWQPAAVCAATVAIILVLRRLKPLLPGALIAMVVVTGAVMLLGWEQAGMRTIGSAFGGIPQSFPTPGLPDLGLGPDWTVGQLFDKLKGMFVLAFSVALLGSIESLLSAVVADGMSGDRHDSNTELIGQGIANLVVPFFGCLPATGVIARTSTNIRAGARSPVAGIVHAVALLVIMLALAPLVVHVPLACLAGVLLVVCWYMAELRHWPHILRAGRSDATLLPLAFLLTVLVDLTWAVSIGVLLAMFFFVKRMADTTMIERKSADAGSEEERQVDLPKGVEVYEVRGPFFFGAATLIRDIDGMMGAAPRAMILRLRNVPFIDATAAFSLRELAASCRKRGAELILSDVHTRPLADLERHGLMLAIGEERIFGGLEGALAYATAVSEQFSGRRKAAN
jgi:SulP family sulfate permease